MTLNDSDKLIRQLIGGETAAAVDIVGRAQTSEDPVVVVAAALIDPGVPELLARGAELAQTTRERQLVAIAAAHLAGDRDLVDALARDHLVDHPDSLLVAWIAAGASQRRAPRPNAFVTSEADPRQEK
jgi:hypothetical protein